MVIYPVNDTSLTWETHPFPLVAHMRTGNTSVPPHHHRFYEISFYTDGAAIEFVNGTAIRVGRGVIVCKQPHSIHETRPMKQPYTKMNMMFDVDMLLDNGVEAELKSHFLTRGEQTLSGLQLGEPEAAAMEALFRQLLAEFGDDRPFRHAGLRAKLTEILVAIARLHVRNNALYARGAAKTAASPGASAGAASLPDAPADDAIGAANAPDRTPVPPPAGTLASAQPGAADPSAPATPRNRMTPVLLHIHSHYLTELTLSQLAAVFHVSPPYISKQIKAMTKMNFLDYVHQLRVEHACVLLVSTDMSILDVSVESGFGSFKTFSRVFKKLKGRSPGKYRARHRDK